MGKPSYRITRKRTVLDILSDGQWHDTVSLSGVTSGGSEGMRRMRELRAQGYEIESRKKLGSEQWEYRLVLEVEQDALW